MRVKVCNEMESPKISIENYLTENPGIEFSKNIRYLINMKVIYAKVKNKYLDINF
jgi:hypothetical protein